MMDRAGTIEVLQTDVEQMWGHQPSPAPAPAGSLLLLSSPQTHLPPAASSSSTRSLPESNPEVKTPFI